MDNDIRVLQQRNAALMLRNEMLGKINEIARGIDSVRTETEVFTLVVESAADFPGIKFALVLKLTDDSRNLVLRYHTMIRHPNIAIALRALGFDLNQKQEISPSSPKLQFQISQIHSAAEIVLEPHTCSFDRLSQLLDEFWGHSLCNAIQALLNIKKIVIIPVSIAGKLWGVLLFSLNAEVPVDILEALGKHCSVALNNVYTLEQLEKRQQELTLIATDNALLQQKLISRIQDLETARDRLSVSEEKMRFTLESISDGVMVTSLDGRVIQANSMAMKLQGYEQDTHFIGKNALRFVAPVDRRRMLEHLQVAIVRGGSKEAGYNLIKKDGSLFPAECSIGTYKNSAGAIEGYVISIRDISERKQVESRLQESERKYRLIADNTIDYISMLTFSGYYTYVSPSHQQLGYAPGELIDQFSLDRLHTDDREGILPILLKFSQMDLGDIARLKKINYSQRLEYRMRDKWGKWHDMLATGNIIESLDGKGFNVLIIAHDITDLKLAETQLKQSYDNEKTVRQALEREINKRADFFRALVHELKTPLTPIIVSSETIMELVGDNTFKNLARNVYNSAMRLNTRVEELLDISRAELGMLKVDLEPLNMVALINGVAGYLRLQLQRTHQKLDLNLPPELPAVMGDENRLRQVLLNLLNNAMKFTPEGGLITLTAAADDTHLRIFVQDTGKGIDDPDLERLFQPYNRIEADRQNFSGLGLGLALCKQLIELHQGKIWVDSQKGKGTTFSFSLPLVHPSQTSAVSQPAPEVISKNSK